MKTGRQSEDAVLFFCKDAGRGATTNICFPRGPQSAGAKRSAAEAFWGQALPLRIPQGAAPLDPVFFASGCFLQERSFLNS